MAWFRVYLTEEEMRVVNEERISHFNERIREPMLVLWLLHKGQTRQEAAEIVGVSRATVQRYVAAFRDGGLDGLRRWEHHRPQSEMAAYRDLIRDSFEKQPVRSVAEACDRILQLTGLVGLRASNRETGGVSLEWSSVVVCQGEASFCERPRPFRPKTTSAISNAAQAPVLRKGAARPGSYYPGKNVGRTILSASPSLSDRIVRPT